MKELLRLSEIEKYIILLERDIAALDIIDEIVFDDHRAEITKAIWTLELEHASALEQLRKVEASYFAGTTSLEGEYKRLGKIVDDLDTQVIEAYDLLTKEEEKVEAYNAALKRQDEKAKESEIARKNFNDQVLKYESEKADLFAKLPVDFQKGYMQALKAYRGDPVAQYAGGCSKCGSKLPSKKAHEVGRQSVNCDGCHRLLIVMEEE